MIGSLPQLIEEDMKQLSAVFDDYLVKSEADSVLLTAEGGFLVSTHGKTKDLDTTTIGALASNGFEANKAIASMIGEPSFNSLYQAGEKYSLYIQSIDGFNLMVVIFPIRAAVGAIKYYAQAARDQVAKVFERARARTPEGLDLVLLNVADSTQIFKRTGPETVITRDDSVEMRIR
jgi:predicted regulator of Ras-like GTPase activity (Roadblock/LC7/MglB family)